MAGSVNISWSYQKFLRNHYLIYLDFSLWENKIIAHKSPWVGIWTKLCSSDARENLSFLSLSWALAYSRLPVLCLDQLLFFECLLQNLTVFLFLPRMSILRDSISIEIYTTFRTTSLILVGDLLLSLIWQIYHPHRPPLLGALYHGTR